MGRARSILLTIAAVIGGFVATQLVIYGVLWIVAWRMGPAAQGIVYLVMAWDLFIGLPVSLGVGVLVGSFVGPRTWPKAAAPPQLRHEHHAVDDSVF